MEPRVALLVYAEDDLADRLILQQQKIVPYLLSERIASA